MGFIDLTALLVRYLYAENKKFFCLILNEHQIWMQKNLRSVFLFVWILCWQKISSRYQKTKIG